MAAMPPSSAGPVILIADDNRDTREMYALYLSMTGYSVALAEDGHEAVVKARTVRPDLIVLDLHMPKVDGWAAMRTLHGDAATARTPIVVLTGHDFKNYLRASALAEGASSFLMKPCLPEHLAREIAQRLGPSRSQASAR
jgi:two-component system cell cycle response regulator DivK